MDLRLNDRITDGEFEVKRQELQITLDAARERARSATGSVEMFEPLETLISFSSRAKSMFETGDSATRARILKILCSNPRIIDKKPLLQAVKPFEVLRTIRENLSQRGGMRQYSNPDGQTLASNLGRHPKNDRPVPDRRNHQPEGTDPAAA